MKKKPVKQGHAGAKCSTEGNLHLHHTAEDLAQRSQAIEVGWRYLALMRRCSNTLKLLLEEIAIPLGATAPQFFCLHWITEHPGVTQAEVGLELGSDANTVSAIVRRLELKQLILRRKHSLDRRAMCLYPTKRGKRVIERTQSAMDERAILLNSLLPPEHESSVEVFLQGVINIPVHPRLESAEAGRTACRDLRPKYQRYGSCDQVQDFGPSGGKLAPAVKAALISGGIVTADAVTYLPALHPRFPRRQFWLPAGSAGWCWLSRR